MTRPRSNVARSPLAVNVAQFRHHFGLHVAVTPNLAPDETLRLHHRLIDEEVRELRDAIRERDPGEFLDALGDIVYLAYGAALECGYDLDEALKRIHQANMAKLVDGVVHRRPDGKVLKPANWVPPTMDGLV